MSAPKLSFAMIKHINFDGDRHLAIKELNQVIEDKALSDDGKCPHRAVKITAKVTGDMAGRETVDLCCYCSNEIEVERVVYRLKSPIPTGPKSA